MTIPMLAVLPPLRAIQRGVLCSLFCGLMGVAWPVTAVAQGDQTLPMQPPEATQQQVEAPRVDAQKIAQGLRASRLAGSRVYNENNEVVGSVNDIMIERRVGDMGEVPYAIISVGGFWGIAGRLVAVPLHSLKIEPNYRVVLPGSTKEGLKNMPEFRY